MQVVKDSNGDVFAIHFTMQDFKKNETVWIGDSVESLQASGMFYDEGKTFRVHHHILNPRTIKRTQEAFVVVQGEIAIDIFDNDAKFLETLYVNASEAVFIYRGGHGVKMLEPSFVYEIKAGQFTCVSEDKEFKND